LWLGCQLGSHCYKFYLRIYIPDKKGYISRRIEGIQKVEAARLNVLDAYLELLGEPMGSVPSGAASARRTSSRSSLPMSSRADLMILDDIEVPGNSMAERNYRPFVWSSWRVS
jgi:hypothetical protein